MAKEPERPDESRQTEDEARERQEALLDEALKETFPASDPISIAQVRKP